MTRLRASHIGSLVAVLGFVTLFLVAHLGLLTPLAHARENDAFADAAEAPVRPPAVTLGRVVFAPSFPPDTRLVSNDYAYYNPTDSHARRSADWKVTSGSLFARDGTGWTGVPDARTPNRGSTNGTGSAIFRTVTARRAFGNVAISFDLLNEGYVTTSKTPAHPWDGVHLFLHYRSQHSLYVLSLNRRDDTVLVKKKQPGGPSNGGTYQTLGAPVAYTPPLDRWQHVSATITTNADGTVTITATINGINLLARTDTGATSPPLTRPGAIGFRGDNTEFQFRDIRVRALLSVAARG
jgi:hypothetical protein